VRLDLNGCGVAFNRLLQLRHLFIRIAYGVSLVDQIHAMPDVRMLPKFEYASANKGSIAIAS
jgi:hypothetical protein